MRYFFIVENATRIGPHRCRATENATEEWIVHVTFKSLCRITAGVDSAGRSFLISQVKGELRKLFVEVFSISMNPGQLMWISKEIEPAFDLRKESGFGYTIAIPARTAAEVLLDHIRTEERAVHFFEQMLQHEGKFVYDSTFRIAFKEDLLDTLARSKWIFDPDTRTLKRDPFFAENLNFLRGNELVDLTAPEQQRPARIAAVTDEIRTRESEISRYNINCQITLRLNRLSGEIPGLIEGLVQLILRRQMMKSVEAKIYRAILALATTARDRMYRSIFASRHGNGTGGPASFEGELENSGDVNLSVWAFEANAFFDLHFKSSEEAISAWTINHFRLSRPEKTELLSSISEKARQILDHSERTERSALADTISAVMDLGEREEPLRVIFHPDRTKAGFLLKRDLLRRRDTSQMPVLDPALIGTL